MLAALALAYWSGQQLTALLSPSARAYRALAPAQPQAAAAAAAQAHWFGEAPQQPVSAPPPIRLIGVYAPTMPGVQGFAIIDENGRAQPLLQGKQTADGWELVKIAPNGVTVRSGGNEQFVPLQSRAGGGAVDNGQQQQAGQAQQFNQIPIPQPGVVQAPPPGPQTAPDNPQQPAVEPAAMMRQ
ncbi:type II secretion system protein N [Chromobacterium sp. IIBBL 290-4]|uniref:type II secretion system protein N n=1 Tax=Chromobacterium sp. IIBBL 290-4 TaxID=2953890 RepID=UPI0020B89334|nr:type II secretion system protein N [Chromobacterium sp. IIBBL 290-4]UTH72275.1 hypothetical protein NKT35_11980 [Chromobacterium sp. IIBBL 290-4]